VPFLLHFEQLIWSMRSSKALCEVHVLNMLNAKCNFNSLNLQLYNDYLNRCRLQFAKDPKWFYNFVNSKRKLSLLPHSVSYENTTANNDQATADLFAEFFPTAYFVNSSSPVTSYPYNLQKSSFISEHVITQYYVN